MAWSGQFLLVPRCVSLRRSNNCCELKAIISRVKNRINAIQPFGFNNNKELCKMPHNHISSRKMFFFCEIVCGGVWEESILCPRLIM